MPICKQCGKEFPNFIKIDGKRKDVRKRTLCIECSPYAAKKNGTYKKKKRELIKEKRICKTCGKEFFQKTRALECSTCKAKAIRARNKTKIHTYLGGKCVICGYNKCSDALDIHHIDPSTKCFDLSSAYHLSFTSLVEEAKKCVLLCSNCHRELHAGVAKLAETHET